jgi:hypothetical protein
LGEVFALEDSGLQVWGDEGFTTLGFGLALSADGTLAAGAPLANDGSGLILEQDGSSTSGSPGELKGGRLAWNQGTLWSTGSASLWLGDQQQDLPERAGDLVVYEGLALVGMPRGQAALWLEGATWDRPSANDEAGYSLCSSDLDGDGIQDVAVGAPGSNRVYLLLGAPEQWTLGQVVLEGSAGRFGHALACAEGALAVGAPLALEGFGAVWLFQGPVEDWIVDQPLSMGDALGEHHGAAVGLGDTAVWVGVPRAVGGAGRVDRISR